MLDLRSGAPADLAADVGGLLHVGPDAAACLARIRLRYRDPVAESTLRAIGAEVRR